ncbi:MULTISPECIES: hypothetical protein [unclassified Acinetobacter]|uniref:hypothetical protein n=1 Tax=unclassified Acinetobacter TaxID=196816 RepID=UPI0015D2EA5C|nr:MULTISPECIES: hypothetical protein [unclassified Acinetobacter]UUS60112.1 hypothetical protein MST17_12190 [Acinetobacter sp. YH16056_T]
MSESNTNNGFVLPTADEQTQNEASGVAQTVQEVNVPTVQEETGSRDLMIAGAIIAVLLIAFFFAKRGFSNSLVKKRISPSKASMAGWWLFIFLSAVAIGAVLAAVNPVKFLSLLILGPLGVVALVSGVLTFTTSRA